MDASYKEHPKGEWAGQSLGYFPDRQVPSHRVMMPNLKKAVLVLDNGARLSAWNQRLDLMRVFFFSFFGVLFRQ